MYEIKIPLNKMAYKMYDYLMKEINIERVSAADYWDGFKEESKEEFSDFLHCGFSVLYSDEEKVSICS